MTPSPTTPGPVIVLLRRRFPGLVFWYGTATGTWWALVPVRSGWRLVEAIDPDELTRAIALAGGWPYPPEAAVWRV